MSAHAATVGVDTEKLPQAQGSKLVTTFGALAVVGLVLAGAGWSSDAHKFAFSYLVGYMFVLSICLGSLFFVIVQHLTRAGWSVAARRLAEWMSSFLPVMAVLFIPIFVNAHTLWHHWMGEDAKHDELLVKKARYLNESSFYTRAIIYFIIWSVVSWFFASQSKKQDTTGDVAHTNRMQWWAPICIALFALSQTFAAFDWIMSLDPHWFSTIFGVYFLAGSELATMSTLALITVQLQLDGHYKRVSTIEHRHDLGKLMIGWVAFWTYIGFSQFFLIWYANIPEETVFYLHRMHEGWATLSTFLIIGHFIIPFWFLMPRTIKRNPVLISLAAAWLLCVHYLDLYWLIMPTHDTHDLHFSWIDAAGLLAPLGLFLAWVAFKMSRENLYPLKDPRLPETYKVDNGQG